MHKFNQIIHWSLTTFKTFSFEFKDIDKLVQVMRYVYWWIRKLFINSYDNSIASSTINFSIVHRHLKNKRKTWRTYSRILFVLWISIGLCMSSYHYSSTWLFRKTCIFNISASVLFSKCILNQDLSPKLIIYDPLNPVNNVGRATYRIVSLKVI